MTTIHDESRRNFLRTATLGGLGVAAVGLTGQTAHAAPSGTLQVWSCGGLAEAMAPAHAAYTLKTGVDIAYTGAFAAVLGKSLMGSGRTDVFGGRVLALAQNLRKAKRMAYFKPLCFTSYVIVTPKGNPGKIQSVEDMARSGVRVAMAQDASPPGGAAVIGLLKNAKLLEKVMPNVLEKGTCVQRSVTDVIEGRADAMIVERRIPLMPLFKNGLDIVEIPPALFPPGPLTFTIGVMEEAKERRDLADAYVNWITGPESFDFFSAAGFVSAGTSEGQSLVEKLGVKDVA